MGDSRLSLYCSFFFEAYKISSLYNYYLYSVCGNSRWSLISSSILIALLCSKRHISELPLIRVRLKRDVCNCSSY